MIPIERYYRHRFLVERIQRIECDIAMMSDSLYEVSDDTELNHLTHAEECLRTAAMFLVKAGDEAKADVHNW